MPAIPPASSEAAPMRRFLSRAETAMLIGMILVVSSLFFTWSRQTPQIPAALQISAVHVESMTVSHSGFIAGVALPLTLCAVVGASTLLWDMTAKNRLALTIVAGAGGLACVVKALTMFALLPGVLLGLGGGALLIYGAVDRYGGVPIVEATP